MTRQVFFLRLLLLTFVLLLFLAVPLPSATAQDCGRVPDCDGDGIANGPDACDTVPGPASNNGCPEGASGPSNPTDPDGDGVVGGSDFCPNAGGHINNNGCPPGEEPQADTPPDAPAGPTATNPPPLPSLPDGECVAATRDGTRVNIRSLPGTEGEIVGAMSPQLLYPVTGQFTNAAGEQWWHIVEGWVASWVVRVGQDCGRVPSFETERGASLAPSEGIRGVLEPDDPLPPGSMLALIPFPPFEEVEDLPLKVVPCSETLFVAVVGSLELPPGPCKFELNNGLGLELSDQGMKLMHGDAPLVMYHVGNPEEGDQREYPPNPCDEIVAYGKAINPNLPPAGGMTSFFPCPEDAPDGTPGKTFILHDIGNMTEGDGMIIVIGGAEMTDGAPFSTLMSNEGWNKLKKGTPDDGMHALDLGGALELQSCDDLGGCLQLLVAHPPKDDEKPEPTNPLAGTGSPNDTTQSEGNSVGGIGGSIADLLGGEAQGVPADDETKPPSIDPSDLAGGNSLSNQPIDKPPQDCSTVSVYHSATIFIPGNTCEAGSQPDAFYVSPGTGVGLIAAVNPLDGILIDPDPDFWRVYCFQGGLPVLDMTLAYGSAFFTINGSGWGCGVSAFDLSGLMDEGLPDGFGAPEGEG
jgi:hypothetical protein